MNCATITLNQQAWGHDSYATAVNGLFVRPAP